MGRIEVELEKLGFSLIQTVDELTGKTYMFDQHCDDLIFFPFDQQEDLEQLSLFREGHLVIQVKLKCIYNLLKFLINDAHNQDKWRSLTTGNRPPLSQCGNEGVIFYGINVVKRV